MMNELHKSWMNFKIKSSAPNWIGTHLLLPYWNPGCQQWKLGRPQSTGKQVFDTVLKFEKIWQNYFFAKTDTERLGHKINLLDIMRLTHKTEAIQWDQLRAMFIISKILPSQSNLKVEHTIHLNWKKRTRYHWPYS